MDYAYYSSLSMVTATAVYIAAFFGFAAEWASARRITAADADSDAAVTATSQAQADRLRVDRFGRMAMALTAIGLLLHVAGIVLRGVAAQRAPWGNMYEFVTTTLAFIVLGFVLLAGRYGMRWLGLPLIFVVVLGMGLAVTVFYVAVAPLVPALHSVWFVVHIVAAAIAGAMFNVGGAASVLYLVKGRRERRGPVGGYLARIPSTDRLDQIAFRATAFALPLWTFTICAGAIWAQYAWGRFWNWDPKETWSLVTWVIYAAYLHARVTAGWKGRKAAWLGVLGVVAFWWNFVGINLLVSGLHSYAGI